MLRNPLPEIISSTSALYEYRGTLRYLTGDRMHYTSSRIEKVASFIERFCIVVNGCLP